MRNAQKILSATALMLFGLTAMAQTPAANPTATPGIDKHQANQEKRIEQGEASGALNQAEAHRLHRQQDRIEQTKENAKADGVVTAKERRHLHKMQKHASKRIHRQKHDSQHDMQHEHY